VGQREARSGARGDLPAVPPGAACLPEFFLQFNRLADSAGLTAALVVLLRHILILVIFARVSRDGFLGDFLHETLRVLFVVL
jgi:hypothetical protein